jgi:protein involved in polysaccharide export with SLBB domain
VDHAERSFTILGQVNNPGNYTIPGGTQITLMEAVGMAGGLGRSANLKKVMVRRQQGGRELSIQVNLKELSEQASQQFYLRNGDVITITETWW